jgi:hypothetical protein
MIATIQQIQNRLLTPINNNAVLDAINHENRIRFHAEAVHDKAKASPYYWLFLQWVKDGIKLPADKYSAFVEMCNAPFATNASVSTIHDEYEKIFSANDAYFNIQLGDEELTQDCLEYIGRNIKLHELFKTEIFETYKSRPNTLLVIDLPEVQVTPWPEPFIKQIPIGAVRDIEVERNNDGTDKVGFLIYRTSDKVFEIDGRKASAARYVVLDDVSYSVWYENTTASNTQERYIRESYILHNLEYTPATFIPNDKLYKFDVNPVARKVPLSRSLFDLDWLLWYITSKRCFETFGVWPIITRPKVDEGSVCTNVECVNGWIAHKIYNDAEELLDVQDVPCPTCASNKMKQTSLVGPGTVFNQRVPVEGDTGKWIAEVVGFTVPPVDTLEYVAAEIERLEWKIYEDNVGDNNEMLTKQAVNEDQVQNSTKGKENLFLKIAKDFERAEKFCAETISKLRYGTNWFVSCELSYGQQFLLYTISDVQQMYRDYKSAGLPMHMIAQKRELLSQTEHKNNPYQRERTRILDRLEPFVDLSLTECISLQYHLLFPEDFDLKVNFISLLQDFEDANGDIVEWGAELEFQTKIVNLKNILKADGKKFKRAELPRPEQPAKQSAAN